MRIAEYGVDYTTFKSISVQFDNLLFLNPELPGKYFSNSVAAPSPVKDGFYKIKQEDTYRIFVLGGSSAAGYPYIPNVSFAGFLKRNLEVLYTSQKFEVVNLGISAVNSFFMRDIIDDVLEQSPDLILIYAGHNEYYGAFGSASNDIASFSPSTAQFILKIREMKIYQLLSDFISTVSSLFAAEETSSSKTLMEAMVGDNIVEPGSDVYSGGINNFRDNLDYLFRMCSENDVPVIAGELTSNLMQAPLQNILDKNNQANSYYNYGMEQVKAGNLADAAVSLKMAKESDALRFRAPADMNDIIYSLAGKYKFPVVKIDSLFSSQSINGIPGFELFVDHLHPNINGYKMMANLYLKEIEDKKYISGKSVNAESSIIETYLNDELPFTELDSVYSSIQLRVLLNSYPFKKGSNVMQILNNFSLGSYTDTLAMGIVTNRITWEDAHKELAEFYFNSGYYNRFFRELNVLIEDKPYDQNLSMYAADKLMSRKKYNSAGKVLVKMHKRHPGAYTSKKLGAVAYESKNYKRAVNFLNQSLNYGKNDPEIYFRLSASYFQLKEFDSALLYINKCLNLDPDFPNADKIYKSLLTIPELQR